MQKYYDLNGREKSVKALVKISDKSFEIDRVVIAARVLYSNLLCKMGNYLKEASQCNDKTPEEIEVLTKKIETFQQEKMETYNEVIRLLLEKNGYLFDLIWWEKNTDELDIRAFIETCMIKDSENKNLKKKIPK